jgi:hypothetical protein
VRIRERWLFAAVGAFGVRALGLCAATLLLAVTLFGPTPVSRAAPGTRVSWLGNAWYLQGPNVPWFNWACDFGCGASGGVSDPAVGSALASTFSQLNSVGAHSVRWWVFEGDAHQITRDANGAPTGVDPNVYADFDAALQLAQTYDLYYDFVLFSAPTAVPATWINDPAQRAQLASALRPLFARYANNPHILSWEVVNEPEWDIWNGKIAQAPVQQTVAAIASAVHDSSHAYATVGSAMLSGLPMWTGLGLDYYQAHWYDNMSAENCARCTDYVTVQAKYNLDAPLVIGELYAGADTDAYQRFVDLYSAGYAGAWPWSLLPGHTNDHMAIDLTAMQQFAAQHTDIGPQAGGQPPLPTATPTMTSTATATSTLIATTPTVTATPPATTQTVTFDDLANPNRPLSGQYPTGVIDWGSGAWWLASPWGRFASNSISFIDAGPTTASLTFLSPRVLLQADAYNGGNVASTITLSCAGQPTRSWSLGVGQMATFQTGWTGACTSVTVGSSNGWDTNFDNMVIK